VTQYVPERVTPRCMSASQAIGEQTRTAQRHKNRNASLNVQDKLHRKKKTRRLHLQEVQAGGARIALRPGRTDIKQRRSHPHGNAVRGHLQVVLRSTVLLHERASKASNARLGLGGHSKSRATPDTYSVQERVLRRVPGALTVRPPCALVGKKKILFGTPKHDVEQSQER
jgi:hypothetical protein